MAFLALIPFWAAALWAAFSPDWQVFGLAGLLLTLIALFFIGRAPTA